MALKIIPTEERVSGKDWGDVDKTTIRGRLTSALEEDESGVRSAVREVYGLLVEDDLEDAPSQNWKLPHHEIQNDEEVVLNENGLNAGLQRFSATDFPDDASRKRSAEHFAKHLNELDREIPDVIADELSESGTPDAFMLSSDGKFVNARTGAHAIPTRGSVLGMVFSCALARVETADDEKPDQKSLFAAPEDWPSGLSENEASYFATYRALSASVVMDGWVPIDFTKDGVLKRAASKLSGNPFLLNHSHNVRDQVGVVKDSTFEAASGKRLPGINALVEYEVAATNATAPNLLPLVEARMANSVSVSVWYQWDQSHPDMDENDFFWNLGEEVDGDLVRLMVNKITEFTELSQVWQGADRTAKRLSASHGKAPFTMCVSHMTDVPLRDVSGSDTLSAQNTPGHVAANEPDNIDATQETSMEEHLKKALAKLFGVDVDEIDEEFAKDVSVGTRDVAQTKAGIELTATHKTKQDEYVGQVESRDTEITDLKARLATSDKDAEIGRTYLEDIRGSAVSAYKKLSGDDADDAMLSVIAKADITESKALTSKFEKELDEKFPATCSKCGEVGTIERASSIDDPAMAGQAGGGEAADTTINL